MSSVEIIVILACLFAGGVMKGAAGVGVPILALPAISAITGDLRLAVVVLLVPGFVTNVLQVWQFRAHWGALDFVRPFLVASGLGMAVGTVALAYLPLRALTILMLAGLITFIIFRFSRPELHLSRQAGGRIAVPAGFSAGFLQGASGLSGPIILPYMSALRLGREAFAGTISLFFLVMSVMQSSSLAVAGLVDLQGLGFSVMAMIPVGLGLLVGGRIGSRVSPAMFDRTVLAILCLLAVKLAWDLFGA